MSAELWGEIIGTLTLLTTIYYTQKKRREVLKKVELEKAVIFHSLIESMEFVKKQFGEAPNGGGIMEQLKDHITETRESFATVIEDQFQTKLALSEVKVLQSEHSRWHERSAS